MALGATGMTCASLMRVGRLILDGGVEKLNIGCFAPRGLVPS